MPADIPLSHYAYLIETTDFYNYTLLYTLMDKGVFLRVADQPFSYRVNGQEKEFRQVRPGSRWPTKLSPQVLHQLIVTSCEQYKGASIGIHSVEAGLSTGGMDLGSNRFRMITKPSVALLTDREQRRW